METGLFFPEKTFERMVFIALMGGMLGLGILFFFPEINQQEIFRDQVGTVDSDVVVQIFRPGAKDWSEAKRGAPVFAGDLLKTAKGQTVTLSNKKGERFALVPENTYRIERKGEAIDSFIVGKKSIERNWLPIPKGMMRLTLPEVRPLEAEYQALATKYQLFLSKSGKRAPLKPLSRSVVLLLWSLSKPIVGPDSVLYDLRAVKELIFEWAPVGSKEVSYRIEVATDPDFREIEKKVVTTKTTEKIRFAEPGNYYWRVTAILESYELRSEVHTFSFAKRGGRASTLGKKIAAPESSVVGYVFEISADEEFEKMVQSGVTMEKACPPSKELTPGAYYCRIKDSATDSVMTTYPFEIR